ncbi:MAG: DUF4190 domain-containing protein [Spirochaetes bacterium]|uniref:DUF4190 domain-containing protein n=1 Tax=Candidatus Ornithospirochaeta stercoripullorum TaxID=2840899 RepID=A0A9D9E058_9SPIO|nr:DUF4190 domain-containing protein [Candidatus Ornithospirochaeta stercoripullorum]
MEPHYEEVKKHDASLVLGILSVVFVFICQIAGLILGIVGLRKSKRNGANGNDTAWVLNVIGIVMNAVILFIILAAIIFGSFVFFRLFDGMHYYHHMMW